MHPFIRQLQQQRFVLAATPARMERFKRATVYSSASPRVAHRSLSDCTQIITNRKRGPCSQYLYNEINELRPWLNSTMGRSTFPSGTGFLETITTRKTLRSTQRDPSPKHPASCKTRFLPLFYRDTQSVSETSPSHPWRLSPGNATHAACALCAARKGVMFSKSRWLARNKRTISKLAFLCGTWRNSTSILEWKWNNSLED